MSEIEDGKEIYDEKGCDGGAKNVKQVDVYL